MKSRQSNMVRDAAPGAGGRMTVPVLLVLVIALCLSGCRSNRGQVVRAQGSTSVQPFAEMLAEEFTKLNPGYEVDVQGGGSTQGVQSVVSGLAAIGMVSRNVNPEEGQFTQIEVARDGLAVVVHPWLYEHGVRELTLDQVRQVFGGRVTNWNQVGGPDKRITVITREEGSGTREAFVKLIMKGERISRKAITQESNGSVKELVKTDRVGVGYMSLGLVREEDGRELLKSVAIRMTATAPAVEPTAAAVENKTYPLVRPFLFITNGQEDAAAKRFIDFVLSPEAQAMLQKEGLIPGRGYLNRPAGGTSSGPASRPAEREAAAK